jgi:hypothetical protein
MIASREPWQSPRKTLDIRLPRAWPFLQNLVGVHNLYVGRLVSHVVEGDKEYIIWLSREANPDRMGSSMCRTMCRPANLRSPACGL